MDSDRKQKPAPGAPDEQPLLEELLQAQLEKELLAARNATERQSIMALTRELARLPLDEAAAALEASATIAGVSLRASIEFLRAAPQAAQILAASDLRAWADMGRRLAMSDVETAITFFVAGVDDLRTVPAATRALVLKLCGRQMTLSASIATETLRKVGPLAQAMDNAEAFRAVLEIATEIARRSAKHSADFLAASPQAVDCLTSFTDRVVWQTAIALAFGFAERAGGIAADAWRAIPGALARLDREDALRLLNRTIDFLERGGGGALHVLLSGADILRNLPEVFDSWIELLWTVAQHGNASLVAFIRSSPKFIRGFSAAVDRDRAVKLSKRVIDLTRDIAVIDGEAALSCFRASPGILRTVAIEQFEEWARGGLATTSPDPRARRSYFALETRGSFDVLHSGSSGLALESIQHLLRLYVEGLTGREVTLAAITAVPIETRIGDGRTIHLPSLVAEFGEDELDFRLYKVLAAHAAGQIEFATHEPDTTDIRAAYSAITEIYDSSKVDLRDGFALDAYLMNSSPNSSKRIRSVPAHLDYRHVLDLFPQPRLARRIFGTMENGRIDARLRHQYRGLARDLDLVREHLRRGRPRIIDLPAALVPFELLFQITVLGGALPDSREYYGQVVSELETVAAEYLSSPTATVQTH